MTLMPPLNPLEAAQFNAMVKKLHKETPKFSKVHRELYRTKGTYEFYIKALELGKPFDARQMMKHTGLSEATVYRALKQLRNLGLVVFFGKFRHNTWQKGGPRLGVWMVV